MASEKRDESFRVVDRRLFTSEGELRQDAIEQEREKERQEQANAQKTAQAQAPAPVATQTAAVPAPAGPGPAPATEPLRPSRHFQMLVDLLARNAALFLGGYADPATGRAMVDLDGAREMIDMIEALREKTHGNLAAEDERLLNEVVNTLKLSFVEVSKAAASAPGGREGAPAGNPTLRGKH